jgi:hypothetical protein
MGELPVIARSTSGAEASLHVSIAAMTAALTEGARFASGAVPPSIPADQAYYWSIPWQRDVKESLDALNAGEFADFEDADDPNDVVRWLLADDDE